MVKIDIDAKRAKLLEIITPTLGFNTDIVIELIVEVDPNNISKVIKTTFFSCNDLYSFQ